MDGAGPWGRARPRVRLAPGSARSAPADEPPALRPPEERLVQVPSIVHTRRTEPRTSHVAEDAVDRRIVGIGDPPVPDLGREPPLVDAPVVLHRSWSRPFSAMTCSVRNCSIASFIVMSRSAFDSAGGDSCTSATNAAGACEASAAVDACTVLLTRRTIPSANRPRRDAELSHAGSDLDFRTATAGRAPPGGGRMMVSPSDGEVIRPSAGGVIRTRVVGPLGALGSVAVVGVWVLRRVPRAGSTDVCPRVPVDDGSRCDARRPVRRRRVAWIPWPTTICGLPRSSSGSPHATVSVCSTSGL